MNRKASGKFEFDKTALSEGLILEDITRGECDFDFCEAVQARKVGADVFLVCDHHKNLLEKK